MKKIEPTVFKTKAFKTLMSWVNKPPKVEITPILRNDKDEQKKAKQMEKWINYVYKHNVNGATTKYFSAMRALSHKLVQDEVCGIQTGKDTINKLIKKII
jgi:hypothetical protein